MKKQLLSESIPLPERVREKRGGYYSGRKQRHTIKSQVVVERGRGLILDVSSGWEGSIHDLKVFEGSKVVGEFGCFKVKGWTDKGYVGIGGIARGWEIEQPKEKPEGRELREEGKERNREINRVRIEVAHGIMATKRYQVFGGMYRGREKG